MDAGCYQTRLHKFSSKPPGHDAARQRENQRRHRARVKGRIAELEELLSSTQNRLDDALKQIESLTAEVQRLQVLQVQGAPGLSSTTKTQTTAQQLPFIKPPICSGLEAFETASSCGTDQDLTASDAPLTLPANMFREASVVIPEPNLFTSQEPRITSLQPLAEHPASSLSRPSFEDPNDDCALLPPPSAGESTIPCREAYSIIKDRSPPEFDLSTAIEWLLPGFRCAIAPGTGCRVQTHVLFAFVDHITPM